MIHYRAVGLRGVALLCGNLPDGHGPVGLGNCLDFGTRVRAIAAQEPEPLFQTESVFLAVVFVQVVPIPANVTREELLSSSNSFGKRSRARSIGARESAWRMMQRQARGPYLLLVR